nr:uncharacterized protein LOC109773046 [Aegilops tauschii subsp. strangulata]
MWRGEGSRCAGAAGAGRGGREHGAGGAPAWSCGGRQRRAGWVEVGEAGGRAERRRRWTVRRRATAAGCVSGKGAAAARRDMGWPSAASGGATGARARPQLGGRARARVQRRDDRIDTGATSCDADRAARARATVDTRCGERAGLGRACAIVGESEQQQRATGAVAERATTDASGVQARGREEEKGRSRWP